MPLKSLSPNTLGGQPMTPETGDIDAPLIGLIFPLQSFIFYSDF